jgi:hypothetical protein
LFIIGSRSALAAVVTGSQGAMLLLHWGIIILDGIARFIYG